MLVYIMMLIVCVACGFLHDRTNGKAKKVLSFIAFFTLFIVSAIRYQVGTDYTNTYVRTYELVINHVKDIRCDIGFLWLNQILASLNFNVQWIFVITSLIINIFICKKIDKSSKSSIISYYIYICSMFYFFTMNGIRQAIIISLFYYSLDCIKERKMAKYMIINFIGFLFHSSAFIFFPLYFILNKKKKLSFKLILLLVIFLSSSIIMPYILNFLLTTKYAMYINNGAFSPLDSINLSSIINLTWFLAYELLLKEKDDEDTIYSNIHFLGIIISLFITSLPLALRIFMSFRYIEFISVPNLISKLKTNKLNKGIFTAFVLVFYFAYFIYGVGVQNGNDVLPYKTILGDK